jgi:hypothetical protein
VQVGYRALGVSGGLYDGAGVVLQHLD